MLQLKNILCVSLSLLTLVCASSTVLASVVELRQKDFTYGTYIIDKPGNYRLAQNISFNPNSLKTLQRATDQGFVTGPMRVEAADTGMPLFSQFRFGPPAPFTPGGPASARYDPSAYGIGFFAAIVIQADNVNLDLNGFRIEQSAEHALMQRFFAVIELADQPFIPKQGPADFGERIRAARNIRIHNGTIGRSAHHGIHGNANANINIHDIEFVDFEVAAVALNGVDGLTLSNLTATNRKDVPVLGTFSSAMFIKPYVDDLVRSGSRTTLTVNGRVLYASDIQRELRRSINRVHEDLVSRRNQVGERVVISKARNPEEYALFHNPHGIVDGNSYGFVVNHIGVAVDGFPTRPNEIDRISAKNIEIRDVHIKNQLAFINEIPTLQASDGPVIDPVGAVFQVLNLHPDTDAPVTVTDIRQNHARYVGNPVANAQAFVGKAKLASDVGTGRLDVSRLSITPEIIAWVEQRAGSETLKKIDARWLCNGDSMFHVNKGVIAFKIDSAQDVRMTNTSVDTLVNIGKPGTSLCGDYSEGLSHPKATLAGYGGAHTRAYTFAGSRDVTVNYARARRVLSLYGTAQGFSILTDTDEVKLNNAFMDIVFGGVYPTAGKTLSSAAASGIAVAENASNVTLTNSCLSRVIGYEGSFAVNDASRVAKSTGIVSSDSCRVYSSSAIDTKTPMPMVSYRVDTRSRASIMDIRSDRVRSLITRVYNCRALRNSRRVAGESYRYPRTCVQIASDRINDRDLTWAKRQIRVFDRN